MRVAVYARSLFGRLRGRADHPADPDLRQDPRTDHLCSLRNLLRTRARVNGWPLLALGTSFDLLIAASESGPAGEELLVRARMAAGAAEPASLSFAVGRQVVVLAVDAPATPLELLEISERVRCIMQEWQHVAV